MLRQSFKDYSQTLYCGHLLFVSAINVIPRLSNSSVIRQIKWANLKALVTRKQCTPNFPKNQYFLPPDTYTSSNQWVRNKVNDPLFEELSK